MVRTIYKFFVLSSVVINCAAWHNAHPLAPCTTPAHIWYILGFVSILLLLVLSFLIYVLIKTKFLQNFNICNKKKIKSKSEKVDEGNQTQTWPKKSMRRQNSDKNDNEIEIENNQTLKRQDSAVTVESDFNIIHAPKKSEGSGGVSPRIIKNVGRDMPIILPEQMSQICKAVLNRKNKSEDSKGSLQNIERLVNEGKAEVKSDLKYASTPELDLYDVPSTPENIATNKEEQDAKENCRQENIAMDIETSSSSNALVNDQQRTSCDIYDLPKELSSKMQKHPNYIVAYFPTANISETPKTLQEKPKYISLQDPESSSRSTKENTTNIVIKAEKGGNPDYYEIPIKGSDEETKMYINANDNFFTG